MQLEIENTKHFGLLKIVASLVEAWGEINSFTIKPMIFL